MKQYFALVVTAGGKVVSLNHDEVPENVPSGLTVKILNQSSYESLMEDFNYNLVLNVSNVIITDELASAKFTKIQGARAYYESRDKFTLNAVEYRIDLLSLRNLFTDLMIREKDIAINGLSACGESIKGAEYISGYSGNIDPTDAMKICLSVRCYKRAIEANLYNIIAGINACTTVLDVTNYPVTHNYPVIPNIENI